jgi:hypothetical protein
MVGVSSRLFKRLVNEAAGEARAEAHPLGYVEDCCGPRTKLGGCFSSRQGSTVTSTNAGTESAPFLSVTRSLNR